MSTQRLYAIVFRLAVIRPGAVPGEHGDHARAALMHLLRESNFPLAQQVHDTNMAKPYTISLLQHNKRSADRALHFGEGDTAEWRFTLLSEITFEALLHRYLLNRTLPHVRIGAVEFAILDAFASGERHHDSGHISLAGLTERWNCDPHALPPELVLNFLSPTVFNLGVDRETKIRRWRYLPDSRTLFSTLRKKWLRLGGAAPGDEFDDWVQQWVEAEPLTLRLHRSTVENLSVPGFSGRVRFHVYGDMRWLPLMYLLAELTFWTGAGYQTTRGLGQVRRE